MPEIITGSVVHHRNGVMGEPFYTVQFKDKETKEFLIAIVTDRRGGCHVINPADTAQCYRGDNYEKSIRNAIVAWYCIQYNILAERVIEELNDGLIEKVY